MPRQAGIDAASTAASKARISLRADIDKLMDYFLLTESVRYQEFARVWQALNFALIYVGLKDTKEKKDFILDAFELVSEFLQPPFDLQRRVCALYTLYGLYYTQTHYPRIKIRMSLEDWKETLALHDDLQDQGHLDALYIFHKMRLDKAFMFTATHTPMFYQGRTKKPEDFEKWAAKHKGFMESVLDEDLLQDLDEVHKEYQDDKQTLNLHEDASMTIVTDSMSDYVMERISNIDVPREVEETEALTDSRSRASRLREIKKRSFASPTQGKRGRYSGTETDEDPTYSPVASKSTRKGGRRKGIGRPRTSDSDASLSSPKRKTQQAAISYVGESDTSFSSPRGKKRKDTSSDASGNVKIEGSPKKKKRSTTKSSDKSENNKTLETLKETNEVEGTTSEKKTSKKDGKERKRKQKSPSKDEGATESGKKKKKKLKKNSSDKQSGSKRTPKAGKDKDKKPKKSRSKKIPTASKDKPSKSKKDKVPKKSRSKKTPTVSKDEPSKSKKDKDKVPKKSRSKKTPTVSKDEPSKSSNVKNLSADSQELSLDPKETVKVKLETPTKESGTVEESPRKNRRKSNTPRRLTQSQEKSPSQ